MGAGLRDALRPLESLRGDTERENDLDRPLADSRWEGIDERRRGGLTDMAAGGSRRWTRERKGERKRERG